jgi:hypothetical protein
MDEQDPFSKAAKWKVPTRKPDPDPDPDGTRPMTAHDDGGATRVRSAQPAADDETGLRPAQPLPDDVTRAAPALPASEITRIGNASQTAPAELTHVAQPAAPLAPAAPDQPPRRLPWPLLAAVAALVAAALYMILER